ncbi:hypothetical protein Kpho02_67780 [Kitasatospora phosalacinea]|uniref:Uncharacterized protein n=1 Tax=Kitasatospora phosalacinea TaxID=2065 RepID=A0A9W6V6S8_9ACTN|nr:hypothetical protein [Kitasatospora phosalacinea]GLW74480.1 hypothetical protein Kpho02_67780 [Kitasatospora phosalacinea]
MRDEQPGVPPPPTLSPGGDELAEQATGSVLPAGGLFRVQVAPDLERLQQEQLSSEEADRARSKSDQQLYERLKSSGFAGLQWELFADALATYALPILMNWLYTGEIFAQCAARGRPVKRRGGADLTVLRQDRDEREELACETIARGIRTFREHAMVNGGWRSDRGASLKTYFVGAAAMEFGAVYERWASEHSRRPPTIPEDIHEISDIRGSAEESPEASIEAKDFVSRVLSSIPDGATRTAAFLAMNDYSNKEIGEHLNMSAGAVAMRLSRLRRQKSKESIDSPTTFVPINGSPRGEGK